MLNRSCFKLFVCVVLAATTLISCNKPTHVFRDVTDLIPSGKMKTYGIEILRPDVKVFLDIEAEEARGSEGLYIAIIREEDFAKLQNGSQVETLYENQLTRAVRHTLTIPEGRYRVLVKPVNTTKTTPVRVLIKHSRGTRPPTDED